MFGLQDDLAYSIGWKSIPGESDVKKHVASLMLWFGETGTLPILMFLRPGMNKQKIFVRL
jgi:hypothetical protein